MPGAKIDTLSKYVTITVLLFPYVGGKDSVEYWAQYASLWNTGAY